MDLFKKQGEDLNCMDAFYKPWQTALKEEVNKPTDRYIIWVIRKKENLGKIWFQKYIKKGCHLYKLNGKDRQYLSLLSKISASYNRHFLFNIARSNNKFEEINYE